MVEYLEFGNFGDCMVEYPEFDNLEALLVLEGDDTLDTMLAINIIHNN